MPIGTRRTDLKTDGLPPESTCVSGAEGESCYNALSWSVAERGIRSGVSRKCPRKPTALELLRHSERNADIKRIP